MASVSYPYAAYPTVPSLGFLITHALPYVTVSQLDDGAMRADLARLERGSLVASTTLSLTTVDVIDPLVIFQPGDAVPDMGLVARSLHHRWLTIPTTRQTIYFATAKAAKVYGGIGGRVRQPLQVSHDLLAASVFFHRLETHPDDAHLWRSEMLIRSYCPTTPFLPDAVVLDRHRQAPALAIEIGGKYSRQKLERFHRQCFKLRLPYEIW